MNIVVIGGGPGGYSAAFEAARLGADVTLVEADALGGTCLNRGCIPTKTLLKSAHLVSDIARASEFGVVATPASIDVPALRERVATVVSTLVGQVEGEAKRLKVDVVKGFGRLTSPTTVEVDTEEGRVELSGDAIVLALGSEVVDLPFIDRSIPGVWTSDEACAVEDVPKSAIVLGGGVIGIEFAGAWAAMGAKVTVVELASQIAGGVDKRAARALASALGAQGVAIHTATSVEAVREGGDGVVATLSNGEEITAQILLSAVGRRPATRSAGLEEVGVALDRGAVVVDGAYRTNIETVWAIGDAIGGMMLAHVAEDEGVAAARNIVATLKGESADETVRYDCVPACIYTTPEIATVGSSRDFAKERGIDAAAAIVKFTGNGKAIAEGAEDGFVQIVGDKATGAIIGGTIVGPHAVELIHEIAFAIRGGITARSFADATFAHPTVSEAVKAAASALASQL